MEPALSLLSNCKAVRVPTKAVRLGKLFGGKWTYHAGYGWWCDDGVRHVSRVATCDCDDTCSHPAAYYLYGGSDGTKNVTMELLHYRQLSR